MPKLVTTFLHGDSELQLVLTPYESQLLVARHLPEVTRLTRPHSEVFRYKIPASTLLENVRCLLAHLQSHAETISYRYGLLQSDPKGLRVSGGTGSVGCRYAGELAIARAGPGFCHITECKTSAEGRRILHDMSDMVPVQTDDGWTLTPTRRSRPVQLLMPTLQKLHAFLEPLGSNEVRQELLPIKRSDPH